MLCRNRLISLTGKIYNNFVRSFTNNKQILPQCTSNYKLSIYNSKNDWIWERKPLASIPTLPLYTPKPIELPGSLLWVPPELPSSNDFTIEAPSAVINIEEKQAARLIVIRKRKMKKHKLKKLRKRMKFEWAKVRQRREMRKEKKFQGQLIAQIKTAEKFSAEQYVLEKIRKATETPLPRLWKGRRLPEFIIRQKLGLDQKPK